MKYRYVKDGYGIWQDGARNTIWNYIGNYLNDNRDLKLESRYYRREWIWALWVHGHRENAIEFRFEPDPDDAVTEALNAMRFLEPVSLHRVRVLGCEMQVLKERTDHDSRTKPDGCERRSQGVEREAIGLHSPDPIEGR